jgi:hypothetical protein
MSGLPPKPANTEFGVEIDGKRQTIRFKSVAEAEETAPKDRNVVIFDAVTGAVVKRLP